MMHSGGCDRHATPCSMKYVILLVAAAISHFAAASIPDEESSHSTQKEALLTPALRYRRYRILQVEDPPKLKNEIFGKSGASVLTQQGKPGESERLLNIDKTVWGRLLQSDGSISMSMPSAPIPMITPTSLPSISPAALPPSQPPVFSTSAPSVLPTTCSSTNRSDTVIGLLEGITPDLEDVTSTSPQGMALSWILDEDLTDPCADPNSIQRRYALATLFFSTSGESWFNSTGWLSMESECSWHGLSCSDTNDVERFELAQNNLGGTLPSELIAFSKLQSFDVYSNIIGGTIPTALETLTDLSLIDLEENLLTGSAFLDIRSLRELSSYRVSLNSLSGTISADFYPGASSSLHELWFARNRVNGSLPESLFSQNTEIQSFIAYGNQLTGSLPSSIGQLRNLVKLQLHENAFASTLPNELFSDTALQELRLDKNALEGTVSTLLGDLVNLVDLRIGENLFTGTLPAEIAKLSNLAILLVNATQLTGVIRDAFEPFRSLRFADFSKNKFSGPLPESIFESGSIELLYFSENLLTGSIPPNYGNASNLSDLYINNNKLAGTVPPILPGQLPKLTEFLLFSNSLTGTMPASICSLKGDDPENDLTELVADCGGQTPLIQCDCCNGCITPP